MLTFKKTNAEKTKKEKNLHQIIFFKIRLEKPN